MLKRILLSVAVILAVLAVIFFWRRGPVGYWHGFLGVGDNAGRINLVIYPLSQGGYGAYYDNLAAGKNNQSLKNVAVMGKNLHCEYDPDGVVELHMDWLGQTLKGTSKTPRKTYDVDLARGKDFMLPRLSWNGELNDHYTYQPPQKLEDGWEVGDLRDGKTDVKKVEEGIKSILDMNLMETHSLSIVHHGKLVLDEYFYDYGPLDFQHLNSVTKSVMGILFGIAQERGWFRLDEKLYDYFPQYRSKPGWTAAKNKITLEDLLDMTSGLDCEDREPSFDCSSEMQRSSDWLSFILSKPLNRKPGERFGYCTTCLVPLGEVVARKSGLSLPNFAQKYLYDPLGIKPGPFEVGPNGVAQAGAGWWLRPRDMAKLGLLYLNKGKWNGNQIVSEKWVEESTSVKESTHHYFSTIPWDYGYLWWVGQVDRQGKKLKAYSAVGYGGQYIWVVPDLGLVVVMTTGNSGRSEGLQQLEFLEKYVAGAFSS